MASERVKRIFIYFGTGNISNLYKINKENVTIWKQEATRQTNPLEKVYWLAEALSFMSRSRRWMGLIRQHQPNFRLLKPPPTKPIT